MEYLPGDLFDKCTILRIKKDKGLKVPEYETVLKEVRSIWGKDTMLSSLYDQLWMSNLVQYDLEDLIRSEKDLAKVGEIALKIRDQNDNRVILKNRINRIFDSFEEVKLYKRS